jgi:hypothetical protein
MAYRLSYWKYQTDASKPDNLDEVTPPRRIRRVSEIPLVIRPIPSECDVITLDRTDRQSPVSREIWVRPSRGRTVNT